jgi:hypothetical protein
MLLLAINGVLEFDINDLDFFYDDVVIDMNFNNDNLENERTKRVILALVACMIRRRK